MLEPTLVLVALLLALGAALVARRWRRRSRAETSGRARFEGPRPGGVLVLVGADWSRTRLDGAALDVEVEHPEGIDVIFPGRHRLESDLGPGRSAIWEVALHAGDVVARRLDRVRGEWVACECPPGEGPARLVPFARKSRRSPEDAVREARERIRALLARVSAGEPLASAVAQASKIGDGLVGVPLEAAHWPELRGPFELAAREALARRDRARAHALALCGLALFPEDPALLELCGHATGPA